MNFEEAIHLRNETKKILWERLRKPTPYASPIYENRKLRSIPILGLRWKNKQNYQFAIRVADRHDREIIEPILDKVPEEEIDFQVTGSVTPYSDQLCLGAALSHCDPIASQLYVGTLGCFVYKPNQPDLFILSNNHVLANLNKGQREKDYIILHNFIYPKNKLGKKLLFSSIRTFITSLIKYKIQFLRERLTTQEERNISDNKIAILTDFIELKPNSTNLGDAAIAKVTNPNLDLVLAKLNNIEGVGQLKGYYDKQDLKEKLYPDSKVTKIGRKTGQTWGKVTMFGSQLTLDYNQELVSCGFDDVIEIEGLGNKPFSEKGDSGSLIVDRQGYGVALLFAGTPRGGGNGRGLTYAIPISPVLNELKVELILGSQVGKI